MPRRILALAALAGAFVLGAWVTSKISEPRRPAPGSDFSRGVRTAPIVSTLLAEVRATEPFRVEPVLDGVPFRDALFATQDQPDAPLYVLEQQGVLWAVDVTSGDRTMVLDVSDRTYFEGEAGALGVAFRLRAQEVYLFYVTKRDGTLYDRVSRFPLVRGRANRDLEEVLIEQRHDWHRTRELAEHFGGGLLFGPDGHLYIGFGDEGWTKDRSNPQNIGLDLFSGVLRIDVDCIPGESHPPPRQPESGVTRGYCIPDDNPFVGIPGALEEFFLIGLRNPYRFSFDRESGRLWVGDVGSDEAEEINVGVSGGNYQWSYREGSHPHTRSPLRGRKPSPFLGLERPPVFAYPHGGGNGCIIGGFVYRGSKHEDLIGSYVFGDLNSGQIWAMLSEEGGEVVQPKRIAQVPPYTLLSFGEMADGELLLVGRPPLGIGTLAARTRDGQAPPSGLPLSETGLFSDLSTLEPAPGVIPYEVNVPAWSDGARTTRWTAIPGTGSRTGGQAKRDRILYRRDGHWRFPAGSVFVQHLELPIDDSDASRTRRLETRVLVLGGQGGAYGATFRWNEEGTDAFLLGEGLREDIQVRTANGGLRTESWTHPSPSDCLVCHHLGAGHVLGGSARQLARAIAYQGGRESKPQLETWDRAGMFTRSDFGVVPLDSDVFGSIDPLVPTDAVEASLEDRARSYLDANCAFCHGPTSGLFDLSRRTPTSSLIGRPVRFDFGHEGARLLVPGAPELSLLYLRMTSDEPNERMPPIGRSRVDPQGAELVEGWIATMPPP